jgi:hypothetical protein
MDRGGNLNGGHLCMGHRRSLHQSMNHRCSDGGLVHEQLGELVHG